MTKFFRKQSKRVSCKKRYKIEKKIREHHRKMKKEARKNPKHKGKKKDPGVPNSLPFKQTILDEAVRRRQQAEELKQKRKENRQNVMMQKRNLADVEKDARKRSKAFENKKEREEAKNSSGQMKSQKSYYKEFRKVVEAADVVLEVLDARDPLGSRCLQVEEAVTNSSASKKLVLVLSKIDLVPRENLLKWLKYLRNEFPTVLFKSSTQTQQANLSRSKVAVEHSNPSLMNSSRCLGASALMSLLGNYACSEDIQKTIIVGVVGFPNVGKSSLINSLKRSKACTVGATPGVTKVMQEVHLDKHIKLLDSPGVVLSKETSEMAAALRNTIKIETIADPILPVQAILQRANKEEFMLHYRLPTFNNVQEFLSLLAKRTGKLKKGGVPDTEAAARRLLQDWNVGKIKYYTHPPERSDVHVGAEIVHEMGQEFNLASLEELEKEDLKDLPMVLPSDAVQMESLGPSLMAFDEASHESDIESAEEEMETNKTEADTTVELARPDAKSAAEASKNSELLQETKSQKAAFKKLKKKRKRADKLASKLSDTLSSAMTLNADEDYDFKVDFQ